MSYRVEPLGNSNRSLTAFYDWERVKEDAIPQSKVGRREMMNRLLRKLSGGDPRSDGRANEVAEEVIQNPQLLEQLLDGLNEPDDIIRGRTAHALERVSRTNQDMFRGLVPQLTTPTLLLVGGDSPRFLKVASAAVYAALPSAKIVAMPGQQHVAMDTGTDRFTTEVLHFLMPPEQSVPARSSQQL